MSDFRKELERLINKHNRETVSNTPEFILARYLSSCLHAFDAAVNMREGWYGRAPAPRGRSPERKEEEHDESDNDPRRTSRLVQNKERWSTARRKI
jgi:hypothetical protein